MHVQNIWEFVGIVKNINNLHYKTYIENKGELRAYDSTVKCYIKTSFVKDSTIILIRLVIIL